MLLFTGCILLAGTPAGASNLVYGQPSSPLSKALRQLVTLPDGPPGAIALVQVGDQLQVSTAGVADVEAKAPIAVNDTARIASVSKAFSGAVALSLVSEGDHEALRHDWPSTPRTAQGLVPRDVGAAARPHRSTSPTTSRALRFWMC